MAKSRPFGVTLLAIFALLGAIAAAFHAIQMFFMPFGLFGGPVGFFGLTWLGAIMWVILALIYLWVFRMLWSLDQQGWLFVTVISVLNLILAFMSILGNTSLMEMLPSIIVNALILIYALLPGTKAAFGVPSK
ncbi:MAG TPA: hypothetical protein GYA08_00940 [Chloroflexi bacterium]|nr:hypothetical protein [Chloroflexota bacterium]